jgi:hypothetical protein
MINRGNQIKTQILDTERLLNLASDHPIMSISLKNKLNSLREELSKIPDNYSEAKIILLFSGKAVKGSKGIKAKFLSNALKPFQELVKTQTALVRFGHVGKRGKTKHSVNSELYLTALPTGSFGVELSQIETSDMFAEQDVAEAIGNVVELINAATISNDAFEEIIEKTPVRNLNNLKAFLKEIDEEHSMLKIETGSTSIEISEEKIHQGFERVNAASNEDSDFFINGLLRGILLDSGKFEITDENGYKISGFISPDLSEETVIDYNLNFLNKQCTILLKKSDTHFISGKERVAYELIEISEPQSELKL